MAYRSITTDHELKAILGREIRNSLGYIGGELSEARREAHEYYMGEPFGDEVEGRSQVVSTDVADVIEWIMPSLLKIFTSGDKVVNFAPEGPEDIEQAEQASEYTAWIFNRDNPGFQILYTWFKDALLSKNGVVKVYWDEKEETSTETYSKLTEEEFDELVLSDEIEVDEHTAYPEPGAEEQLAQVQVDAALNGQPQPQIALPLLHDVKVKRTKTDGRVQIEPVPPEEFLIERRAKSVESSNFCAHRVRKTRSELLEMGFDRKVVETLPTYNSDEYNEEVVQRHDDTEDWVDYNSGDHASDQIWLYECYARLDLNGDGKTELWQVFMAGEESYEVLDKEQVDKAPFESITPIIMPHRWHGRSIAELIMDLQRIKSTVLRQLLDNMYGQNNNGHIVSEDGITEDTLDDLLTNRVNRIVRVRGHVGNAITPMSPTPIMQHCMGVLEYVDTIRENRTGVTKYNQGLDADSLNKTAQGMNQILSQAQMRVELVARVFAETGVKGLFRQILELINKHQRKPRMIQLRQEFVPMDPSGWSTKMDMTVNVGLGTGDKERMVMMLMQLLGLQKEGLAAGGVGGLVTPKHLYNTLEKLVESMGLKTIDPYFGDPEEGDGQQQQQQPDPMMQATMMQMQLEQGRLELDREKMLRQDDLDRDKLDADIALRAAEIQAKHGQAVDVAAIKGAIDLDRESLRAMSQAMPTNGAPQ